MKVSLQRVEVVDYATIDVPDACPRCTADLTKAEAVREMRVCHTTAYAHIDREATGNDVVATDTSDGNVTWYATEWLYCAFCNHDLVAAAQDAAEVAASNLSRKALVEAATEGKALDTCDED